MARYTIVKGLPELAARLRAVGNIGDAPTMKVIGEAYAERVRMSYNATPHPYETGALEKSINVRSFRAGAVTVGAGGTSKPAARAIEYGTKQRRISPRRARRLAFWWAKENRQFIGGIGQSVNHPQVDPKPFFERSFTETAAFTGRLKVMVIAAWNKAA